MYFSSFAFLFYISEEPSTLSEYKSNKFALEKHKLYTDICLTFICQNIQPSDFLRFRIYALPLSDMMS